MDKTATEQVCAMLDERGVEYTLFDDGLVLNTEDASIELVTSDGEAYIGVTKWYETPEQAIEAALGRGECHDTEEFASWGLFVCSECKAAILKNAIHISEAGINAALRYCPNCRCKVVVE